MNKQWTIIFALLFTLIVAIFAVINVRAVEVDYLFGTAEWPLILVILGSVLMGALIVFSAGIFQVMKLKREIKMLRKENRSAGELTADSDGQKTAVPPEEMLEEKKGSE
ncbi:Lipopolysaccharide assembly protein A [Bacillus velezensis]|uniref:LapA family protein n=1 Tax=Bacillus velezensis TaxID=492670 RepID=UPI00136348FC|nr:lipopolysaccharide assembly LapA domain-containing protein [Bacillus velezensis]QHK14741.1 Lipopolysaccharide assembly protein A [Bacillus velezensis]QHK62243.1 Lipopolysaccharide assembly protein A [Bacillus velezensis]QHL94701.1 Lipopolysaccharide assembly protein A [Bacillus velezensis]QHL98035.1 Lipopolysaccharide assembly protein A [Bacillus velezensis]